MEMTYFWGELTDISAQKEPRFVGMECTPFVVSVGVFVVAKHRLPHFENCYFLLLKMSFSGSK